MSSKTSKPNSKSGKTSKRSKTSEDWLARQNKDEFVKQAKLKGYRSRAAFKLLEIQEKDKLITPGATIVDIGAAPGGWSQIAKELVGEKGFVLAIDVLPVESIAGVDIIEGDFSEDEIYQQLLEKLGERRVNVVISDIAPNLSGIKIADQAKAMYLVELALDFAINTLDDNGSFIVKVFHGIGFEEFLKLVRSNFKKVLIRKPKSSRKESKEVYIVAKQIKRV